MPEQDQLPLFAAMQAWCDPTLVGAVKTGEAPHSAFALNKRDLPTICDLFARRKESWESSVDADYDFGFLDQAWKHLLADFRSRVDEQQLFLGGVEADAAMSKPFSSLRGEFVAMFNFDFRANTIMYRGRLFGGVRVSRNPYPNPGHCSPSAAASAPGSLDPKVLSGEKLLELLEAHARHVIAIPDAKLIAPGKVSLLPILLQKMEHRGVNGELCPSMTTEAAWLAEWIKGKVAHFQTPKASTISKVLGTRYHSLGARSKPGIQKSKN